MSAQVVALRPITISLDDLLAEVQTVVQEGDRIAKVRKEVAADPRAKDLGGLTPKQRLALRAQVLQWEIEAEWFPQAFVAVEQVDHCASCGGDEAHIVGVYQYQLKRTDTAIKRFVLWAPEEATDKKLPRTFMSMEREVALCTKCLWQQGWTEKYEGEVKP